MKILIESKRFLLLLCLSLFVAGYVSAQDYRAIVKGIVTDETGESIIGATIMIGGTGQGTVTDMDGRYSLQVIPGDLVSFTFVGMADKVVKAQAGKKVVNVKMETNATALADVVVTGYQTLSKERATGSYSVISEKSTKGKLETDVLSRIEGMVAGINKRYDKEDDSKIVIRGITTVNGEQDPLYVVAFVYSGWIRIRFGDYQRFEYGPGTKYHRIERCGGKFYLWCTCCEWSYCNFYKTGSDR